MKTIKRLSILLLVSLGILLLAVGPALADATKPTDVPPDHWAYKAVVSLVEKGYLTYYQDGSFRGDQPIDRFNLAVIVAKILNEIAVGNKTSSKEDITLLRKLTTEFQDELVALSTKVNLFDDRLTYLENGYKVAQDDSARNENDIQALKDQDQQLHEQDKQLLEQDRQLQEQAKQFQEQAKQLVAQILTLTKRVEDLEGKDKLQDKDIGAIRDRLGNVETDVKKLKTWNVITTILAIIGLFT